MRILFICGREPGYTRNSVIMKGLEQCGVELIKCTSIRTSYPARYPDVVTKYLARVLRSTKYDCVFAGFLGQPLVPIIRALTNKPIILDAFLSVYDTLCFERKRFTPSSLPGRLAYELDRVACLLADKVILDTAAHADYFINTFKVNPAKFHHVFVGADDDLFRPSNGQREGNGDFRVLFYSTYRPIHGTDHVVQAAKFLEKESIAFDMLGTGITYKKTRAFADSLGIRNINFEEWVPYHELPRKISAADICLGGHFSGFDKAARVIPGKTFQIMAMKKPVIVADNAGNRELLTDGMDTLMVKSTDSAELAEAVVSLKREAGLSSRLAENGYQTFRNHCRPEIIGQQIVNIIESVLD